MAYQGKGELDTAIEWAERITEKTHATVPSLGLRGWIYGIAGRDQQAAQMIAALKEAAARQYVSPWHFVAVSPEPARWTHGDRRCATLTPNAPTDSS